MDFTFLKTLGMRFLRGFVSGAIAAMVIIGTTNIMSWSDVVGWLNTLGIACVIGGITGGLLALDKSRRYGISEEEGNI